MTFTKCKNKLCTKISSSEIESALQGEHKFCSTNIAQTCPDEVSEPIPVEIDGFGPGCVNFMGTWYDITNEFEESRDYDAYREVYCEVDENKVCNICNKFVKLYPERLL